MLRGLKPTAPGDDNDPSSGNPSTEPGGEDDYYPGAGSAEAEAAAAAQVVAGVRCGRVGSLAGGPVRGAGGRGR